MGGAVVAEYRIHRTPGTKQVKLAGWEITRLRPDGLTFYPARQGPKSVHAFAPLPTTDAMGITWFNQADSGLTGNKAFSNSSSTWQASTNGKAVFMKRFPEVADG